MPVGISPTGDLLQHRARRLRGDGRARPPARRPRASTGTSSSSWRPPSSPAAPAARTRGDPRRPDAARAGAVHLRRRRRGLRRRRGADVAGLLRRLHAVGARDGAAGAARPAADAEREAARPAAGDGVVQARQARHDPGLPRAGAAAAAGRRAWSFDVIPIPGIERNATVGSFSGMCVSGGTGNATAAADFLVHMISPVSVRRLVSRGPPGARPTSRSRCPTTSCSPAGSRCTPRCSPTASATSCCRRSSTTGRRSRTPSTAAS